MLRRGVSWTNAHTHTHTHTQNLVFNTLSVLTRSNHNLVFNPLSVLIRFTDDQHEVPTTIHYSAFGDGFVQR